MFTVLKTEGKARRGEFETVHGTVQTPAFMNVATCGAIKGGVAAEDLKELHCQVALCNTYHLSLRPGDLVVKELGGLHKFMNWDRPILTDSGGFQVFSLSKLRKIKEEGVYFRSHLDGHAIFMGPEESMQIQSHLGSTIAMAFDECVENPAPKSYAAQSCQRTVRWLYRCKDEMERLLDGYAIGGLAVGEPTSEMYRIIEAVEPHMPVNKPRYLMGVGTPVNILEAVHRGVDLFDCVMPSRNARHGTLFTWQGIRNLNNEKYIYDNGPVDPECDCPTCRLHSRAYVRHLLRANELLAHRLTVQHNLFFYNTLMERIREALDNGTFEEFYQKYVPILGKRI